MNGLNTRTAANLWAAGFVGAAALHIVRGRQFARKTLWGPNAGWQREIAIWNVAMLLALVRTRRHYPDADHEFLPVFATMTLLLGPNHLAAALRSPRSTGNWVGLAANVAGLAVARAAGRGG